MAAHGKTENKEQLHESRLNALVHEKSPYLLQHAKNPVHRHPWGTKRSKRQKTKTIRLFPPSDTPTATGAMSWPTNLLEMQRPLKS